MMSAYRVEWPAWLDWYEVNFTPSRQQNSNVMGGGFLFTDDTDNTYAEWQQTVAAGTYTLNLIAYHGPVSTNNGYLYVDGAQVGSAIDMTSGSYNTVSSVTNIALTEGVHTFRLITVSSSSGSHRMRPQWFSLERTGA